MTDFKFELKQEINMECCGTKVKAIVIGRVFKDFIYGTENSYVLFYDNVRYEQSENDLININ